MNYRTGVSKMLRMLGGEAERGCDLLSKRQDVRLKPRKSEVGISDTAPLETTSFLEPLR